MEEERLWNSQPIIEVAPFNWVKDTRITGLFQIHSSRER
jgi:hypothetical protein